MLQAKFSRVLWFALGFTSMMVSWVSVYETAAAQISPHPAVAPIRAGQVAAQISPSQCHMCHGTVYFDTQFYSVNENELAAVIRITRRDGVDSCDTHAPPCVAIRPLRVTLSTVPGGNAIEGSDYQPVSKTVDLPDAGSAPNATITVTTTIPIINDTSVEFDKTVNLKLSDPKVHSTQPLSDPWISANSLMIAFPDTATLTIVDDDVLPFDYTLSNNGNITVIQGGSGSNTITRSLSSGVTQAVSLSVSGLPAGATVQSNNSCSPTCSSTLTVSASANTLAGTYPITVTGSPLGKITSFNLVVIAAANTAIFQDNMENGTDGWSAQSPWAQTSASSHSPTRSWTDSPGGNYANNANVLLWSPVLNFLGLNSVTLSFWHRYNLEDDFDFARVFVTTNDGASFTQIQSFTGTNTTWSQVTINLDAFVGNPSVRIVFQLVTDGSVTADGWYIDDVVVTGTGNIGGGGVDFDGDGRSDIAVYRNGAWFILRSSDSGVTVGEWGGLAQDIPVPADYDGDGKTDVAVYRDGVWFIIRSSDSGVTVGNWGGLAQDIPVPADYDGDGKTDVAVYRDGVWFIIRSSDNGVTVTNWGGLAQDVPVPADYDGDGKTDVAVYRRGGISPTQDVWFIKRSSDGGISVVQWGGLAQDVPVPADYDGDGKTDVAVYRDGVWFTIRSSDNGITVGNWGGLAQDVPVSADYDGDGKTDIAVYRNGTWFILRSSDNGITIVDFGGVAGDIPL